MIPKILFYDVETLPVLAYIWDCGKQVVRPHQIRSGEWNDIICICYGWSGDTKIHTLSMLKHSQKEVIKRFDKILDEADCVIGQNSESFDNKVINAKRLLLGLPPNDKLYSCTDDLYRQLKRYFKFPSYKLDYVSKLFGKGGKGDIGFEDWIVIKEKRKGWRKTAEKMIKYCKKDVLDTMEIWNIALPHMSPKFNMAVYKMAHCCPKCGSGELSLNGQYQSRLSRYQRLICKDCRGCSSFPIPSFRGAPR